MHLFIAIFTCCTFPSWCILTDSFPTSPLHSFDPIIKVCIYVFPFCIQMSSDKTLAMHRKVFSFHFRLFLFLLVGKYVSYFFYYFDINLSWIFNISLHSFCFCLRKLFMRNCGWFYDDMSITSDKHIYFLFLITHDFYLVRIRNFFLCLKRVTNTRK